MVWDTPTVAACGPQEQIPAETLSKDPERLSTLLSSTANPIPSQVSSWTQVLSFLLKNLVKPPLNGDI